MTELFEAFGDSGEALGLVPRNDVHARGLWHRSAHVFVWSAAGEMLLQRRAADKDLYASLWDCAVGEHLTPGESYEQAASRGVFEELGIKAQPTAIGELVRNRWAAQGYDDREIQQAFTLQHDGPFDIDLVEVAEIRFFSVAEIREWLQWQPEAFTPWFAPEVARLGLL